MPSVDTLCEKVAMLERIINTKDDVIAVKEDTISELQAPQCRAGRTLAPVDDADGYPSGSCTNATDEAQRLMGATIWWRGVEGYKGAA